ncbi:MAG: precorrin-3B C(17)-methyltransferase [Pseudoflavonifractor sp.]
MKLTVVGLGPGGGADLTGRARAALEASDLIVGYTAYIALIQGEFPDKEFCSTGMKKEVDRCRAAVEAALTGREVAVVCSGDSGVYGMAGLIYEVAREYPPIDIEVVPGITAACGGAALLGAPLTHDFAVISLSDLLTPWEKIALRLDCAARADFVLCLYNPASHSRPDHLKHACDILLQTKAPETVCGMVRNIGREGELAQMMTLAQLRDTEVDMFTTVFVGSSQTRDLGGKMVTPRGYLQREG